jgi:DNA-binding MarR family transcriptional regulator
MQQDEILNLTRQIFTTGRMLQEWICQIQTRYWTDRYGDEKLNDVSIAQANTIMTVRTRGELSVTELATLLRVSVPSASTMVDRLVEKKILTRRHSRSDRRRVVVGIAPEALEDIENIEGIIFKAFLDLVERIGLDAARKWSEVLLRVKTVLEAVKPPA